MLNIIKRIKDVCSKDISLFLFANGLYSLSTGLISILSPFILDGIDVYENFIYIFQNIMFLTSIFTAGFTVALLRYYKYNPPQYEYYYTIIVLSILGCVTFLGIIKNNYLTQILNLRTDSLIEHFLIYLSVTFSLMYIFNRATLTAKGEYKKIAYGIAVIFIIRIIGLLIIAFSHIKDLSLVILIVCIFPMCNELLILRKKLINTKKKSTSGIKDFILFALKSAIIGSIFLTSNRLLVISVKEYDNTMAASLSFANGLIGIITILNTTISSFYIGKLDCRDTTTITTYLLKIKKSCFYFLCGLIATSILIYLFVSFLYPNEPIKTAWLSAITIIHSGIIFYFGLVTLLAKTYNYLNIQLIINSVVCAFVYILITILGQSQDIIIEYILVNLVILAGEGILLVLVLNKYRQNLKNAEQSDTNLQRHR